MHRTVDRPGEHENARPGAQAEKDRRADRGDHAEEEHPASAHEIAQHTIEKFAARIKQNADRSDLSNDHLVDARIAEFANDQRRRDRKIRSAEVATGVSHRQRARRQPSPALESVHEESPLGDLVTI